MFGNVSCYSWLGGRKHSTFIFFYLSCQMCKSVWIKAWSYPWKHYITLVPQEWVCSRCGIATLDWQECQLKVNFRLLIGAIMVWELETPVRPESNIICRISIKLLWRSASGHLSFWSNWCPDLFLFDLVISLKLHYIALVACRVNA